MATPDATAVDAPAPNANPADANPTVGDSAANPSTVDATAITADTSAPKDALACVSGQHICGNACVANTSPETCGTRCLPCTAPQGATATCEQSACAFKCQSGLKKCGDSCIAEESCCTAADCPQQGDKKGTCDTSNGKCRYDCPANTEACGTQCIPTTAGSCCTNAACSSGFACEKNVCSTTTCNSTDLRVCGNKCIPKNNGNNNACCTDSDCKGNFACDTTTNVCSASICKPGKFELCGTKCIDTGSGACCTDSQCKGDFACVSNACSSSACRANYKMCGGSCVPTTACCDTTEICFDPKTIAGLLVWLDAGQAKGLKTQGYLNNAGVSEWKDLSGNNNHALAEGASPTFVTNAQNGRPVVRFDKTNWLRIADRDSLRASALTLFLTTKSSSSGPVIAYPITAPVAGGGVSESPYYWWTFLHAYENRIDLRIGSDLKFTGTNDAWGSYTNYSYLTSSRAVYRNGSLFESIGGRAITYAADSTCGYYGLQVGLITGDIGEILLYSGTLADTERQKVEAYLSKKWGPK